MSRLPVEYRRGEWENKREAEVCDVLENHSPCGCDYSTSGGAREDTPDYRRISGVAHRRRLYGPMHSEFGSEPDRTGSDSGLARGERPIRGRIARRAERGGRGAGEEYAGRSLHKSSAGKDGISGGPERGRDAAGGAGAVCASTGGRTAERCSRSFGSTDQPADGFNA